MKITIVEYKNNVDNKGQVAGHALKTMKEAIQLIDPLITQVIAAEEYALELKRDNCILLKHHTYAGKLSLVKKLKQIILRIRNISDALKKTDADVVWFTNIDWVLFLVLCLKTKKKKIMVTAYKEWTESGGIKAYIKNQLIDKGISKIDLAVITNEHISMSCPTIYLPDFFYSDFYKKYETSYKKDAVLLIGTMREDKEIEKAVEVFNKLDKELFVVGKFFEEKLYDRVINKAGKNITIVNKRLSDDEYYSYIAQYQYILLPYRMDCYKGATSGVLLESIFLKSIPVAPQKLLDYNGINGIGYGDLEEINTNTFVKQLTNENNLDKYMFDYNQKKLHSIFQKWEG